MLSELRYSYKHSISRIFPQDWPHFMEWQTWTVSGDNIFLLVDKQTINCNIVTHSVTRFSSGKNLTWKCQQTLGNTWNNIMETVRLRESISNWYSTINLTKVTKVHWNTNILQEKSEVKERGARLLCYQGVWLIWSKLC